MLTRSKVIIVSVIFCFLSFFLSGISCFSPYIARVTTSDGHDVDMGLLLVGEAGRFTRAQSWCNDTHGGDHCEAMEDTLTAMFSLHIVAFVCALVAALTACCRFVVVPFIMMPLSLFLQCISTFGFIFRGVPLMQATLQATPVLRDAGWKVGWTFWILIFGVVCMFLALLFFAFGFKTACLDNKHNPKHFKSVDDNKTVKTASGGRASSSLERQRTLSSASNEPTQ